MNQLKRIADTGYSQDLSGELKNDAKKFFKKIDRNHDKKVSVKELIDKQIILKDFIFMFNKFDTNGDGVLNLDEMSCLYYFKYVVPEQVKAYEPTEKKCKGSKLCSPLKKALPDYSCFKCLTKNHGSYHICMTCYKNHKHVKHGHSEWMLDRQALDLLYKMKYLLFDDIDMWVQMQKGNMEYAGSMFSRLLGTGVTVGTSAAAGAVTGPVCAAAAPVAGLGCTIM